VVEEEEDQGKIPTKDWTQELKTSSKPQKEKEAQ
jgi:hypothetical protein